ncbi:hypothetical protein P170DRAFT_420931 [Aspergillus steynii IBT 23096]|uniref:Uncharacterized protein n=1 Tax=Aspergillus steynii IBT 23096 TaxID=1392250 RepID=A0A2I2GMR7_9EURO|nr:uncharacterized protein P170DRAFT_420931 [Aspergillus steynii IBT 23096]PLB54166.1 hypothetical protein P170DRAFT_420931 [Aspergillus steynii IBT 23096]
MIIPITAILGLASLVPAIPVEGDGPSSLPEKNAVTRELDARMGEISTALDLRSESPETRALMELDTRTPSNCRALSNPRFSDSRYTVFHVMAVLSGVAAQGFCAVTNSGAGCAELGLGITAVLEILIYGGSVYNGDVEHGIAHVSGMLGLNGGMSNPTVDGMSNDASSRLAGLLEEGRAHSEKRSLPDIEHLNMARTIEGSRLEYDGVELVDVSSLNHQKRSVDSPDLTHRMMVRGAKLNNHAHDLAFDQYSNGHSAISFKFNETMFGGESELNKRDVSSVGLKVTFSYPGKVPDDEALRKDLAHGFGKHWGETAFSQTGWSDYLGGLQDTDGNQLVKFRLGLSDGEPSSDAADLDDC